MKIDNSHLLPLDKSEQLSVSATYTTPSSSSAVTVTNLLEMAGGTFLGGPQK